MSKVDAGGAEEPKKVDAAEVPEEEAEGTEEAPASSDPLDAIEDEAERAEAKRLRAIKARQKRREEAGEEEEEKEDTPKTQDFVTKKDMELRATRDAKKLLAPEVVEAWDELVKIPLGGFDPLDEESVAQNMAKRYRLYREDNPIEGEDPKKELVSSPSGPTIGGTKPKKAEKKEATNLPGYKEPVSPEDWY